jgi:transcriptional regulator
MPPETISVLKGTLDLLVLRTLSKGQEMHGFEILEWITEATGGSLVLEEGALYPALHRLEGKGWLRAEWGISEKGRRAKYYHLTPRGRKALAREEKQWERYVSVMSQVTAAKGSGA